MASPRTRSQRGSTSTRPRSRSSSERIEGLGIVVRRTPIGDSDLMLGLFSRDRGLLSVSARGARRASSKLGALEPLHTLRVGMDLSIGAEIAKLRESRIERARVGLLSSSTRLDAAAHLLKLVRGVVPQASAEPRVFDELERGLDALEHEPLEEVTAVLARAGATILGELGYAVDLSACVRCGTPCPPNGAALFDPAAGGLVCRSCGGGPTLLRGVDREAINAFLIGRGQLDEAQAELLKRLVDAMATAHGPQQPR